MRAQFVLSETRLGLRRNLTMTVAAVLTFTITLTLLGLALMIRTGVHRVQSLILNQIEVSVYLNQPCGSPNAKADCLTPEEQDKIQQTLQNLPQVKSVHFTSTAEAYKRFKAEFSDEPEFVNSTQPDQLPESFEVELKDPHQFEIVSSAISEAPGVSQVTNASKDLKALFTFFRSLVRFALALALVLLIATVLLIYITMRVAAFSRRRETGIMRLVGSSDLYIQAPFILEGTVSGVIGSAFAAGLLVAIRAYIAHTFSGGLLRPVGSWSTYVHALPYVIIVGPLIAAVTSFLTLQRHLRV